MRVKELFKSVSDFVDLKFKMSTHFKHSALQGDVRENTLNNFLSSGMLPAKFSIGTGEIVSTKSAVSKQVDLIIYDSLNSTPLYLESVAQIYPIEMICGTVEVKSKLSKEKLLEGLENVKSIKVLADKDKPFGIVFGHALSGNSLNSLKDNLQEWEENNDLSSWPDLIVVNGEGVIFHSKDGFGFTRDKEDSTLVYRDLNKETFFSFYSILLSLLQDYNYKKYSILDYYYSPTLLGKYHVFNHDTIVKEDKVFALKESFINKVYDSLPNYMPEEDVKEIFAFENLFNKVGILKKHKTRLYNPNKIEIKFKPEWNEDPNGMGDEYNYVIINEYLVVYPNSVIEDNDVEEIKGKKPEDL